MSFRDSHSGEHRGGIVVAVALIHAAAIYALVTGLGGAVVRIITEPPFRTHDVRPDLTMPLPPPPAGRTDIRPRGERNRFDETVVTIDPLLKFDPGPLPPLDPPSGRGGEASGTEPSPGFAPKPAAPIGNPALWASEADYPPADLHAGHAGTTRFSLAIAPDGSVSGCTVTASSGWPGLDAATCRLVANRARFRPATDGSGVRVAGSFASAIRWVIPN